MEIWSACRCGFSTAAATAAAAAQELKNKVDISLPTAATAAG
jgi:hypothetical protein